MSTSGWRNFAGPGGQRFEASALNDIVPSAGLRVFVTVDIAEDALGGNMRLSLPTGDDLGVGMASDNDGPIDSCGHQSCWPRP